MLEDAERNVLAACVDAGRENLEFIAKAGSGPMVAIARATLSLIAERRLAETKGIDMTTPENPGALPEAPRCPYDSGPHRATHVVLAVREWLVPVAPLVAGAACKLPVTAVLVSGAVGDYTVYLGIGAPAWVADHGNKLGFDDAARFFPGLDVRRYRP